MQSLDERSAWLVLSAATGVGPRTCGVLLRRFGSAPRAVGASATSLAACPGIGLARAGALARDLASIDPAALEAAAAAAGLRVTTPVDVDYPEAVRTAADPPAALYVRGSTAPFALAAAAIVGTRGATHYGARIARRLGEGLARAGVVVVSGLARGIDGAAHAGSLAGGGPTLAVLGCGADVVYPPEHHVLADEIAACGALISEHPPGTVPHPGHFPRRNRIVAALVRVVVVVEAPAASGALTTARMALELGRDVLAVPGPVDRGAHEGCHRLLRDGATLCETVDDVLEAMRLTRRAPADGSPDAAPSRPPPTGSAGVLFAALDADEARDADELARRTGLSPDAVAMALTELELEARVTRVPGAGFVRGG